jgi:hypothetical protein
LKWAANRTTFRNCSALINRADVPAPDGIAAWAGFSSVSVPFAVGFVEKNFISGPCILTSVFCVMAGNDNHLHITSEATPSFLHLYDECGSIGQ